MVWSKCAKDEKTKCENYRGIALLNVVYHILATQHEIVAMINLPLKHSEGRIKIKGEVSEKFTIRTGLDKEILFNVALEKLIHQYLFV